VICYVVFNLIAASEQTTRLQHVSVCQYVCLSVCLSVWCSGMEWFSTDVEHERLWRHRTYSGSSVKSMETWFTAKQQVRSDWILFHMAIKLRASASTL